MEVRKQPQSADNRLGSKPQAASRNAQRRRTHLYRGSRVHRRAMVVRAHGQRAPTRHVERQCQRLRCRVVRARAQRAAADGAARRAAAQAIPTLGRRMKEQQAVGGGGMQMMGSLPEMYNLVINSNHSLVSKMLETKGKKQVQLAKQAVDLALLSHGMLKGKDLTDFVERSFQLI